MKKNYQRKFLRAPFKGPVLYADDKFVLKASAINISEGGLLLDELPRFPDQDEVSLLFSIPQYPNFKNFSLLKIQTFSKEIFSSHVIHAKAKMVRREELSQDLDNLFKSRFGLEFESMEALDQKYLQEYVSNFSSNIIYLQTLIDSFNNDDETKLRTRSLAKILGYDQIEKIALLRARVSHDYKSLQWS